MRAELTEEATSDLRFAETTAVEMLGKKLGIIETVEAFSWHWTGNEAVREQYRDNKQKPEAKWLYAAMDAKVNFLGL